jgi:glyceraldehyde-3-phosphate dehydrogenase (NADP+)
VLVQDNRFLDLLLERSRLMNMGDPLLEATDLGPLITSEAAEKVRGEVAESIGMGSRCVLGGERTGTLFFQPTVLVDVTPEMPVMKDEVFGPVAPIYPFKDAADAVRNANDSPYGLQTSVFSENIHNALAVDQELEGGGVAINGASVPAGQCALGASSRAELDRSITCSPHTPRKAIVISHAL